MDEADDLVQETLLKALINRDSFKESSNISAWLYTIMKNTFINRYRKWTKATSIISQSESLTSAQLCYSANYNHSDNKFLKKDIDEAMASISSDYCLPFTLYFSGFKYHEIAAQLNIPIGTVKTRIHMARKLLKQKLSAHDYNKAA